MGPHFARRSPPASPPSRPPPRSTRLPDQLRERIRHDHCSLKTEKSALSVDPAGRRIDIRCVQELPGHSDVSTAMTSTHVPASSAAGLASPLDALHGAESACACLH